MRSFHERLTRLGLVAAAEHGFVLAGGYAISAHGIGNRLSADVDLFTNDADPQTFATAVNDMRQAFTDAGLTITDTTVSPLFVDINVSDPQTGESSDIQFGLNYRDFTPANLDVGPVLDLRDAVASKMSALWSRGEARDFIDIYNVIDSGAFTRTEVLEMADQQEAQPMDREMLAERFTSVARYATDDFAEYDVGPSQQRAVVEFFADWATALTSEENAESLEGERVTEAAQAAGMSVDEYRDVTARLNRTHPDSIQGPITGPQGAGESPRTNRTHDTGAERGRGYER
ncbi:hypothetical protein GSY69_10925 [Brevibacterium sp. 5221]|uniref:Nucleotidyl transferase AbiEii/AbiGii toxin family protein n=1 Tax=Brevibacterium rongguiense TaxID=2695267 RepID=A0A6N9HAA0_9MICO|nr:nucleotidyl transferase AbiEii/AbiGii toxin family protein [Brevibacterium rongguiense]MYM20462.1 hypothetical protein [Brevibacterium rongguiense]